VNPITLQVLDERSLVLDEILSYVRPITQDNFDLMFDLQEEQLRALLSDLTGIYRSSAENIDAEIDAFIAEAEKSQSHQALLRLCSEKMSALTSFSQQVSRILSVDPIINGLRQQEFHQAVILAVKDMSLLQGFIKELGKYAGVKTEPNQRLSIAQMGRAIRHATAMLRVMELGVASARDSRNNAEQELDKRTSELKLMRAELEDARSNVIGAINSSRVIPSDMPNKVFITDGKGRLLGTRRPRKNGHKGVKLRQVVWVTSYKCAFCFKTAGAANNFVDKVAALAANRVYHKSEPEKYGKVFIDGIHIDSIATCRLGIVF
jgi:hypothetical protein